MAGLGMDPMAASQGMFGGFGMNMNGMNSGMMGMNFNAGQGMYGAWDGSQNNMWNGSQDKFNPNAFANGMGAQFGDPSGFGGFNMSQPNGVHPQMQQQQFPNQDFQSGYYGPGNYQGQGRAHGGYGGHMQPNLPDNANPAAVDANGQAVPSQMAEGGMSEQAPGHNITEGRNAEKNADDGLSQKPSAQKDLDDKPNGDNLEPVPENDAPPNQALDQQSQLQGIPTIDSLDQSTSVGMVPPYNQGLGRGGNYMRGGFHGRGGSFGGQQVMQGPNMAPRRPVVEGAPAAPRAMRQGLPNTSVFRQRGFQPSGHGSTPPGKGVEASET